MNKQHANTRKYLRREFHGRCALSAAATGGVIGVFAKHMSAAEPPTSPRFDYRPVVGWAKLPAGLKFEGVNGIDVGNKRI